MADSNKRGISTPRSIKEILIFTDPEAGVRYGYDKFEGLSEDGSYAYTGEGQPGDQVFLRGNKPLHDSATTTPRSPSPSEISRSALGAL